MWAFQAYSWPSQTTNGTLKTALVDELALTDPNPSFITNITKTLSAAGYAVDYYSPSEVTVDLFRNLPLKDYRIVLIRSHTGSSQSIITSQSYSTSQYGYEQLVDQVGSAVIGSGPLYFSITPSFVQDAVRGDFHGAVIIAMGCATFQGTPNLAKAFIHRGAADFVGWDTTVSPQHSDASTQNLVWYLAHGNTVQEAVVNAGVPDPVYHARLSYLDAGSVSKQQVANELITFGELAALISALVIGPASVLLIPRLGGRR